MMLSHCARTSLRLEQRVLLASFPRAYATLGRLGRAPGTSRKQVTVVNDDGRVQWGDLTAGEKVARTTQKTFHLGVILLGVVLTGGVGYLLYTEVFSSESKTSHFNRAVNEIKASPRVRELLGPANQIRAFGEPTSSRWARARPIASTVQKDRNGRDHLLMHFNVEGPLGSGVVNVHMVKNSETSEYEYKFLALDVKGHARIYLRNTDETMIGKKKPALRLFGVDWR